MPRPSPIGRRRPTPAGGTAGVTAPVRSRRDPPEWRFGDLLIRRYRHPDEFATVLDMHRAGLARVGVHPGDGIYYESDFFQMTDLYLAPGGEFLIAERLPGPATGTGGIVGMGALRRFTAADADASSRAAPARTPGRRGEGWEYAGVGEMARVRVLPEEQRRGYGTALVLALEERARELGYRELRADTTDRQRAALELYARLGWRETRREPIGAMVNVYLEKRL